jgi:opacity protein-like surface antigen
MTTAAACSAVCLAAAAIANVASARSDIPWDGVFLGANAGEASGNSCNRWALTGATITPAAAFEFQDCSSSRALVGGVRIGENYQYKRLVVGVDADLDFWGGRKFIQTVKTSGVVPSPGTYVFSGKSSPNGFAVIGPRVGYAGDTWLPYIQVGTIIAAGSHNSTLFYTPAGAKNPTASFAGAKNFSTAGWVAGGGFELGLNGAWSITAEYLHSNFGKGSNSTTNCGGSAPACAAFAGVSFSNTHQGFSANMVRVGITYWFAYW